MAALKTENHLHWKQPGLLRKTGSRRGEWGTITLGKKHLTPDFFFSTYSTSFCFHECPTFPINLILIIHSYSSADLFARSCFSGGPSEKKTTCGVLDQITQEQQDSSWETKEQAPRVKRPSWPWAGTPQVWGSRQSGLPLGRAEEEGAGSQPCPALPKEVSPQLLA